MADAKETRRSGPYPIEDDALELRLEARPPLKVEDHTVDASRLRAGEAIRLEVRCSIDWGRLRRSVRTSDPLSVLLVSRCSATRWSSVEALANSTRLDVPSVYETHLEISGSSVLKDVGCEVVVVPSAACLAGDPQVAIPVGTVLGRNGFRVRLERGGLEFPTEWRSFATIGLPASALWVLEFSADDWGLPARDTVKIRLNKDQRSFYDLLQTPSREERAAAEVLYVQIAYDCLATLLADYLATDAADDPVDPAGEALRDVVSRNIDRLFGSVTPDLRRLARTNPAKFRARVQDAMKIVESIP